jgi:ribosomal protein L16 Arg81 hydroxylase
MTLLADPGEAARSAWPLVDLSRLIHPVDTVTFQREYWERQPLVVHRNDPGHYTHLLSIDDVDEILSLSGSHLQGLRVVVDGHETPVGRLGQERGGRNGTINSLEALYARFRSGSTVVLNGTEQRWAPLQRLARQLGAEICARLQANVYMTPPGARGFVSHYDMHDVFVMQVHGSKRWRLSGAPYALPLKGQPYDKSHPEPDPLQEVDMRSGDLMYLPRGTIHSATSNEELSIHITLGVHPLLWSEVIGDAVRKVFAREVRFREGLPIGFAIDEQLQTHAKERLAELLDLLRAELSPDEMMAHSLMRAASLNQPTLRHHIIDLVSAEGVGLDTRVRRRPDLRCQFTTVDGFVLLHFHNKTVRFPGHVADELRFLIGSRTGWFTGRSIPGQLDAAGRVVLVRSALREGLLTLS